MDYQALRDEILHSWRVSKRAESKEHIALALDTFIALMVAITGESTTTSTPNGTAAPLVDAADGDIAELQRITSRCGKRLNIDLVTRGVNNPIFFITPAYTMTERIVSTMDINEIIHWLRRQDLLEE
ncbi:MAG: hypothetical protein MET45_23835 [Nostoc sp. LLA-1]|nr:hypothetical protein [Cyanocohniella sp. LLY]